jgi:hypothetical protein
MTLQVLFVGGGAFGSAVLVVVEYGLDGGKLFLAVDAGEGFEIAGVPKGPDAGAVARVVEPLASFLGTHRLFSKVVLMFRTEKARHNPVEAVSASRTVEGGTISTEHLLYLANPTRVVVKWNEKLVVVIDDGLLVLKYRPALSPD